MSLKVFVFRLNIQEQNKKREKESYMKRNTVTFYRSSIFLVVLFVILSVSPGNCFAQSYPTKPITIICPYDASSSPCIYSRVIAEKLSKHLGQPVVVESKAGAAGAIAAQFVAKAAPDGYTLLIASSALGINMSITKVGYDLVKDFAGVSLIGTTPYFLVTSMSIPVKSIKDLVELAKSKPGQLNFGSSGIGSTPHLLGEILKKSSKIDMVHVPYKGTSLVVPDLLTGRVQLMFSAVPNSVIPLMKEGKLRILGVSGEKRYRALPDVPTFVEAGFPSLDITPWYGYLIPSKTPQERIDKLSNEINKILEMSDVKERLMEIGLDPRGSAPRELSVHVEKDVAMWAKVVKDYGIPK